MNRYLSKAVEISRWSATKLVQIGRWVYTWMRSVEIDQARGVTLCLALQLLVLLFLMIYLPAEIKVVQPSSVTPQPISATEDAAQAAGEAVHSPVGPPAHQ